MNFAKNKLVKLFINAIGTHTAEQFTQYVSISAQRSKIIADIERALDKFKPNDAEPLYSSDIELKTFEILKQVSDNFDALKLCDDDAKILPLSLRHKYTKDYKATLAKIDCLLIEYAEIADLEYQWAKEPYLKPHLKSDAF